MNNTTVQRTVLAFLTTLAFVPGRSFAQATKSDATSPKQPAAQSGTASSDDEMIVLSPFEVSTTKDKGYRATNST